MPYGFPVMRKTILVPILLCSVALSSCSWMPFIGGKDKDLEADMDTTEQVLYQNAQRSLRAGNYDQAISGLQLLDARFPFGRYAEQAQLEIIYAHYMAYDHDTARLSVDRSTENRQSVVKEITQNLHDALDNATTRSSSYGRAGSK